MTQPYPRSQPGPYPPPQPAPPRPGASARGWTTWEKVLGIVTAVVSLVAAILGLQKEQAQTTAEATGSDLSSLQREFNQLNNENQQLRSDNEELRSQLGLPSSPTAGPIPAEGVTIRHSGSLTLAYGGNTADLDSRHLTRSGRPTKATFATTTRAHRAETPSELTFRRSEWVRLRPTMILAETPLGTILRGTT